MRSIYELLDFPLVYRAAGHAFAPMGEYNLKRKIRDLFTELPPLENVVDVGCGPKSWLAEVGLTPVAVDLSKPYAQAIHGAGGAAIVASSDSLPFGAGVFDAAWSFGLLHHLPDAAAAATVTEMIRVTRSRGEVVIIDAVLPKNPWTRPLAAASRRLDRGEFMRNEASLEAILPRGVSYAKDRYTYALTGVEALQFRIPVE